MCELSERAVLWGEEALYKEEICRKCCTTSNRRKALKNSGPPVWGFQWLMPIFTEQGGQWSIYNADILLLGFFKPTTASKLAETFI